jgi:hypothetical protein
LIVLGSEKAAGKSGFCVSIKLAPDQRAIFKFRPYNSPIFQGEVALGNNQEVIRRYRKKTELHQKIIRFNW